MYSLAVLADLGFDHRFATRITSTKHETRMKPGYHQEIHSSIQVVIATYCQSKNFRFLKQATVNSKHAAR